MWIVFAHACYMFTNFSASNIQDIEIFKVNLNPYMHVHVHVHVHVYIHVYVYMYVMYRSMHAYNLEINYMRTRNAKNL